MHAPLKVILSSNPPCSFIKDFRVVKIFSTYNKKTTLSIVVQNVGKSDSHHINMENMPKIAKTPDKTNKHVD